MTFWLLLSPLSDPGLCFYQMHMMKDVLAYFSKGDCFIFDKNCTIDSTWDLVDYCHTSNLVLGNRSPENEWRMPAMRRYSGNQRRCLLTWIYNCGHGRGSDGIVDVGISGLGRCLSSAGHQHARLRCHLLDIVNPKMIIWGFSTSQVCSLKGGDHLLIWLIKCWKL